MLDNENDFNPGNFPTGLSYDEICHYLIFLNNSELNPIFFQVAALLPFKKNKMSKIFAASPLSDLFLNISTELNFKGVSYFQFELLYRFEVEDHLKGLKKFLKKEDQLIPKEKFQTLEKKARDIRGTLKDAEDLSDFEVFSEYTENKNFGQEIHEMVENLQKVALERFEFKEGLRALSEQEQDVGVVRSVFFQRQFKIEISKSEKKSLLKKILQKDEPGWYLTQEPAKANAKDPKAQDVPTEETKEEKPEGETNPPQTETEVIAEAPAQDVPEVPAQEEAPPQDDPNQQPNEAVETGANPETLEINVPANPAEVEEAFTKLNLQEFWEIYQKTAKRMESEILDLVNSEGQYEMLQLEFLMNNLKIKPEVSILNRFANGLGDKLNQIYQSFKVINNLLGIRELICNFGELFSLPGVEKVSEHFEAIEKMMEESQSSDFFLIQAEANKLNPKMRDICDPNKEVFVFLGFCNTDWSGKFSYICVDISDLILLMFTKTIKL